MDGKRDLSWCVGLVVALDDLRLVRVATNAEPVEGWDGRLVIKVSFESPRADGMPTGDTRARLEEFEDRFTAAMAGRAVLVGVITYSGVRDFVIYFGDRDSLRESLRPVAAAFPDLTTKMLVADDPNWEFYAQLREDGQAASGDRVALDRLASEGADLEQPRIIRYVMYFPEESQAQDARRVLADHEYEVEVSRSGPGRDWRVVASHRERAVPAIIARMRRMLTDFAADHHGEFDGWEAELDAT